MTGPGATWAASLASRTTEIAVVPGPFGRLPESEVHPYRPRSRTLPAPHGSTLDRIRDLLDLDGPEGTTELLVLEPSDAAVKIVEQLREWGYLTDSQMPAP